MRLTGAAKIFIGGVCVIWLGLTDRPAAQSALTITPANPTVSIGRTQKFTTNQSLDASSVSAGGEYTCIGRPDGTARCTGRNQFGQLGDGDMTNVSAPVPVSGLTNVARVIAGDEFSCALLTDGTAKCWGLGEKGQRGDGTTDQMALAPVSVAGLTNAVAFGAGYDHACALIGDGTMRCWGGNSSGQLGHATPSGMSTVPVAVDNVIDATSIAVGAFHTCAVGADRTVRCWGRNINGQLGDGTLMDSPTPVTVVGLTNVSAVAAGGSHTCALRVDGSVGCWGSNDFGQLGDGTGASSRTIVVVPGLSNAIAVSAGWAHTCALLQDQTVRCWGWNVSGQVGNGTTANALTPVAVVGLAGASAVTAGWWQHSCARLTDGNVRCWGQNQWGQLGNGTTASSATPVSMPTTDITWASSNPSVATIDSTGLASAIASGNTTITATNPAGATASTTLTVPFQVTLSLVRAGAGAGSVASTSSGIDCGTDCSEAYDTGTTVTLTGTPAANSTLVGWSGCDAVSGTTCTVTMNASKVVTAIFDLKRFMLTVTRSGIGAPAGDVSSSPSGISCGSDCSELYTIDTVVTLTASPAMVFSGWSGCDAVSGATCTVRMSAAKSVNASFLALP